MWLRKGDSVVLVPEHMPETIGRCLGDGWVQIAAPTVSQAALVPEPVPAPVIEPEPEAQPLPKPQPSHKQRRANAYRARAR